MTGPISHIACLDPSEVTVKPGANGLIWIAPDPVAIKGTGVPVAQRLGYELMPDHSGKGLTDLCRDSFGLLVPDIARVVSHVWKVNTPACKQLPLQLALLVMSVRGHFA